MTREARTMAEHHMLEVWWTRVVAMITGWDENTVSLVASREAHIGLMARELAASRAWAEWFPSNYRERLGGPQ